MIIGFDASRAFSKHRTGTENYSFQILSHLLKVDHTNNYKIYTRPGISLSNLNTERPAGRQARRTPNTEHYISLPFPRLWTQVGLALQTFKDPLDVLFIPSHTLPIIRKPGLRTVITVHDLGSEYLPFTHQIKQRLYLKLMTNYQLQTASHIITVSESTKNDLIKKIGIPSEKITVIYEGCSLKTEIYRTTTLEQKLKPYDLKPTSYFLFVGTIQPRKNLVRLIEAFSYLLNNLSNLSNLSDLEKKPLLVLAGGKGWLSDEIYQLPAKLGIEDRVKFLGYVPDRDLSALYQGAIALTFPSLFEGFGLPVLEAFSNHCPVLTSNTTSLPEVAGKAAILVDPYSINEIATSLRKIMNQELRIKLIGAGLKQVKKFNWEKAAKETLEVLTNTGI